MEEIVKKRRKQTKREKLGKQYDWKKANLRCCSLMLNKNTEDNIIKWLDTKSNKQQYIKDLILKDMENN